MSRGLGRIERAILNALQPAGRIMATAQIARAIYGEQPTTAQTVSLRRSLRSLSEKGEVAPRGVLGAKRFWSLSLEGQKPNSASSKGLRVVPIELRDLNALVAAHHRHHKPVQGHRFSLGVERDGRIVGGCSVGRPVARATDQRGIVEVTRLVTDGAPNACSALYGAAARAAKELGYRRIQTFTLATENGASLRAAGWRFDGEAKGGRWDCTRKQRRRDQPEGRKHRWVRDL